MKSDFLVGGSDYLLSYVKLSGKKIKDIMGYISTEYDEPVFKLSEIEFEAG